MNIKFLKELFSELKNNRLKFDKVLKNQNELLKKINEVKMGRKTPEQEEVMSFTILEKMVLVFLEIMVK